MTRAAEFPLTVPHRRFPLGIALGIVLGVTLISPPPTLAADSDGDGVADSVDWCPTTTDLQGPVPTSGKLCDGCLGDDQTIRGCNASDILACRPGPNRREYESGLRGNTQRLFELGRGWAKKCGCDPTLDSDGDGSGDCVDACPNDPNQVTPGPCGCGNGGADSDGDGTSDCADECPNDPSKVAPGICGCGFSDADSDGDGVADCDDSCPTDPDKVGPGICGCGFSDADSDGDGVADCDDSCPDDPTRTEPGNEGCNTHSESSTVADGTPLALQTDDGSVEVPADSLPAGMQVTLTQTRVANVANPPNESGETPVTDVIRLELSQTPPIESFITVGVLVPQPIPQTFRARVRTVGGNRYGEPLPSGWQIEIGRYEAATSTMFFDLRGTADRIEFVVVAVDGEPLASARPGVESVVARIRRGLARIQAPTLVSRAYAQGGGAQTVFVNLSAYEWAVACDPREFTKVDDSSCSSSAGGVPAMLAQKIATAGDFLETLQFERGKLQLVRESDLTRSGLRYATSGDPRPIPIGSGGNGYLVARYSLTTTLDGSLGVYWGSSGGLAVTVDDDGIIDPEDEDTIAHELFHGIQEFAIPDVFSAWIFEATAAAVGRAFIESSPAALLAYRYEDGWRNWARSLDSIQSLDEYEAVEFWLRLGAGDLSYLSPLLAQLKLIGEVDDTNSFIAVNQAMVNSGFGGPTPLPEAFVDLIRDRDADAGYPHCVVGSCEIGASCGPDGRTAVVLPPMAAGCVDVQVLDGDCPSGPWELTIQVEADAVAESTLLLDGEITPLNQSTEVMSPFRISPIFTRIGATTSTPDTRFEIIVDSLCECGDGSVDGQEECDDGNVANGDGCDEFCRVEECGNSRIDATEECDDGNLEDGDGCDSQCLIERECGNGEVEPGEECDDGNSTNEDGCDNQCMSQCGDSIIQAVCVGGTVGASCINDRSCDSASGAFDGVCSGEQCDDGNRQTDDGCDDSCRFECGNGVIESGEECDDGNLFGADGCAADCRIEPTCAADRYLCQDRCCRQDQDCTVFGRFRNTILEGLCTTRREDLQPSVCGSVRPDAYVCLAQLQLLSGQLDDYHRCCPFELGCVTNRDQLMLECVLVVDE